MQSLNLISETLQELDELMDELVVKHTTFKNFEEMLSAYSGSRPTICIYNEETQFLADEYDRRQSRRNDPRRAFRVSP